MALGGTDGPWDTVLIGCGGPDDGESGFFVYLVQADRNDSDRARVKFTQDGSRVYVSDVIAREGLEMLENNAFALHKPVVSADFNRWQLPDNSDAGELRVDDSTLPHESSLLASVFQTYSRAMQRCANWKRDTNAKIVEINDLVSKIANALQ
jgi:hypothetical protein